MYVCDQVLSSFVKVMLMTSQLNYSHGAGSLHIPPVTPVINDNIA